jgi:hypothetical protein
MDLVNFAFIWKEEQEILAQLATLVPENGTIVEIGTAMGGTAMIFQRTVQNRGVKIYSIDTLDCLRARENLKDTDVILIHRPSKEFANVWKTNVNRPIDLLYIDGDHNFNSVFEDFNEWFPLVTPGGTVAFHDYDPIERGGIAHFGVKICLDTLISKGLLVDVHHDYKILSGIKKNFDEVLLDWKDCFQTFLKTAEKINTTRREICRDSIPEALAMLRERSMPFDSLEACYCIDYALRNGFEHLDTHTCAFYDFRRWVEMLSVLEHAHGTSLFPEHSDDIPSPETSLILSKMIAHEQMRISILVLILRTLVDWNP